jgi:AcrR family transcriptional regulator
MKKQENSKLSNAERTKQSKARILQEAHRLFAEKGYHGTRLVDIAEASDITLPGLLHHFSSKDSLLIEVLEARDKSDKQFFNDLFEKTSGNNVFEILCTLVRNNQADPELIRIFTTLSAESISPEHPGHDYFVQRYRMFRTEYLTWLYEAQNQGKIRSDIDVAQLSTVVLAVMDGLQLQRLLDPENVDMGSAFSLFAKLFEQSMQK